MQAAPDIASQRMAELAYLANVLMSGATIQGETFSETEAAQVVSATTNLGATYLADSWGDSTTTVAQLRRDLEQEPGMVRLFQIGYRMLCSIPIRCAEAIFRSQTTRRRAQDKYAVTVYNIMKLVKEGRCSEAKHLIDDLPITFYGVTTIMALQTLIDATPCLPHMLEDGAGSKNIYVRKGYRHISTMEDIATINGFLNRL
jgi:hypothetical protein